MKWAIAILLIAQTSLATVFVMTDGAGNTITTNSVTSGREAALHLSSGLDSDKMYLVWGTNANGYGEAIAINKTEAWWVGPDSVATGETFAVYGRNLSLGGGDTYLYCEEEDEWLTNSAGNTYRSEFTVPADWSLETKTLWAHNGQGRHYGWSDPVELEVGAAIDWSAGTTNTVSAFTGEAIHYLVTNSSAGDTIYLPDGEYLVSSRLDIDGVDTLRFLGESTNAIIKTGPSASFSAHLFMMIRDSDDLEFYNITIAVDDAADGADAYPLFLQRCSGVTFSNCVIDTTAWTMSTERAAPRLIDSDHIFFTDSVIYATGGPPTEDGPTTFLFMDNTDQVFFNGCSIYQINDCNGTFAAYGDEMSFIDCTQQPLDTTDTTGYGWGKGRFLVMKPDDEFGYSKNVYIGGCSLLKTGPRDGTWVPPGGGIDDVDSNSGEVILGESPDYLGDEDVTSATSNTVVVSSTHSAKADSLVTVVSGKGFGQTRCVESATSTTLTLTENWAVIPDNTSHVALCNGAQRIVVYNNYFTGRSGIVEWGEEWKTPNCMVEMYTAGRDWIVDSNTANGTRNGVVEFGFLRGSPSDDYEDADPAYATPCYFTYIANNTIANTYFGLVEQIRLRSVAPSHTTYPVTCGTVWRNNTVTNTAAEAIWNGVIKAGTPTGGMRIPDSIIQNLAVYDNNTLAEFSEAYETRYGFTNQVFVGNTTNGVSWTP